MKKYVTAIWHRLHISQHAHLCENAIISNTNKVNKENNANITLCVQHTWTIWMYTYRFLQKFVQCSQWWLRAQRICTKKSENCTDFHKIHTLYVYLQDSSYILHTKMHKCLCAEHDNMAMEYNRKQPHILLLDEYGNICMLGTNIHTVYLCIYVRNEDSIQ